MMNGYCYLYKDPYENPLNWTAAFKECQTFGASLLVIDDSREQEVIKKQLWDGAYWIGYNRTDTNAYKDVFGAYLPQNVIWAPEQLNKGYGNENCVSLTRIEQGAKRGELRSNYCGNKSGFICKMKGQNKCLTRQHKCHPNATCIQVNQKLSCICLTGFQGNGTHCQPAGQNKCLTGEHKCHPNATCVQVNKKLYCICLPGFQGNRTFCQPAGQNKCLTGEHKCHLNATCVQVNKKLYCICLPGFQGNGTFCQPAGRMNNISAEMIYSGNARSQKEEGLPLWIYIVIATESFALVIIILVTAIFKIRRRRHLKDTLETRNHVDPERQQTAAPTITASGTHRNSIRNRPLPIPHSAYQPNVQRQESIGRNSTLQQNSPAVQQNDSHEPDRNRDETLINGSACQPIMQCQECFERASDLQQNSLTVRQNSFDRSEGHGYENSMPDSSFQPNMQDHESTFDYSRSTLGYSTLWRNVSVDRQLTPFEREDNANENSISDTALLLNVQNLMSRRGYSKLHRNLSLTGKNSSYGLKDNSNKDRSYENSKPAPPQREFEEQDDGIETDTIPSKSDEIYEEIPDKINFTRMKQRMSDGRHLDRVGQEITDQRHFDLTRQEMPDGRHFNPVNPFHSGIFATRALPVDGVFHPPRLFHAL